MAMDNSIIIKSVEDGAAGTQIAEPDEGASADVGVASPLGQPRPRATADIKGVPQGSVGAAKASTLEHVPPVAARDTAGGQSAAEEGPQATDAHHKSPTDSAHQAEQTVPDAGDAPHQSGPTLGGWGWLPSTAALQQAAAGALRDVRELTDSFQQALMVEEQPEEDEGDARPEQAASVHTPPDPHQDAARQAVLHRLAGGDHPLTAGLKALDGHVEQLAGGVAGLLGGFLGTARSAGTQVAGRLEAGLEEFGRSAIRLLESELDVEKALRLSGGSSEGQGEAASFEACFKRSGGCQISEELQRLSSECVRLCERVRAKLNADACKAMDQELGDIASLFTLQADEGDVASTASPDDALSKGHSIVEDMCISGKRRAAEVPAGTSLARVHEEAVGALAELAALCLERLLSLGRSIAAHFNTGRLSNDGIKWPQASAAKAALLQHQVRQMLCCLRSLCTAYLAALSAAGSNGGDPAVTPEAAPTPPPAAQAGLDTSSEGLEEWDASISKESAREQEDKDTRAGTAAPLSQEAALSQAQDGLAEGARLAAARLCAAYQGLLHVVLLASQDRRLVQGTEPVVV